MSTSANGSSSVGVDGSSEPLLVATHDHNVTKKKSAARSSTKKSHPRPPFSPSDFGFSSAGESSDAANQRDEDEESMSFLGFARDEARPAFTHKAADATSKGGRGEEIAAAGCGVCCAFLIVGLVITGAVLSVVNSSEDTVTQVGLSILAAIAALLVSCCCLAWMMCCVGCSALGRVGGGGEDSGLDELFSGGSSTTGDPTTDRRGRPKKAKWVFKRMNDRFQKDKEQFSHLMQSTAVTFPKSVSKSLDKRVKAEKLSSKTRKEQHEKTFDQRVGSLLANRELTVQEIIAQLRPKVFVLHFNGDMKASAVEQLRDQISLVLQVATKHDKVVLVLSSPGGAVSEYGLVASQLVRIKQAQVHLTVCVDTVAASGGYMAACVADHIVAAPFAFIGSIGVITYIPNFQKAIEKHDVDMYVMYAGKYKRTVDVVGEVTEEGKEKLHEELEDIHFAFREHVRLHRPGVDVDAVSTGEGWLAVQAKALNLVDEIAASDDILVKLSKTMDVLELKPKQSQLLSLLGSASATASGAATTGARSGLLMQVMGRLVNLFSSGSGVGLGSGSQGAQVSHHSDISAVQLRSGGVGNNRAFAQGSDNMV